MRKQSVLWMKGGITCLSLFLFVLAHAQSLQLTGRIVETGTKKPVSGAAIKISGTKKATISGGDGTSSIWAKKGDEAIITYVGYESQTIKINDDAFLEMELTASSNQLNDVVVTALGIKKETKK
jgi:hypothetical protein